jgi:hypothetical protein
MASLLLAFMEGFYCLRICLKMPIMLAASEPDALLLFAQIE